MKLLFDHNLSPNLVQALTDLYPGAVHVRDVGLHKASDEDVWAYAVQQSLTIVSKDADFHQRSFLYGHPPKVVWVRKGNCSTREIEALLRARNDDLLAFDRNEEGAFLILG